jgi:hypothetical protein
MGPDHCPQERDAEPGLPVGDVGPSGMQPIINLPDFGGLEAKNYPRFLLSTSGYYSRAVALLTAFKRQ